MPSPSANAGAPRAQRRRRPSTPQGRPSASLTGRAASHDDAGQRHASPSHVSTLASAATNYGERDAVTDFASLGLPQRLIDALARTGVTAPFPIQARTLPDSLAGRDVLGRGKTGSGKTIAFALPTIMALVTSGHRPAPTRPRSLILVPTRELANQVAATLQPLAVAMGLKVATVFGGVGQNPQVTALRNGLDICVACPGRLEDLIGQGYCRLDKVEVTVLDEADHMADLGFLPAVKRLLDATPNGQRMLFSATLDKAVDGLVRRYLHDPVTHSVDPEVAPVDTMTHHVLATTLADKLAVVTTLASGMDRSLLFTRTKHGAKKLSKQLTMAGIPAVELHGNLSQNARERNLASFSEGSTRVLVATDIAARGIHVDEVALVVHVDPPAEHKAYLHRSGRTARAGASGVVITVMTPDQVSDVRALTKAAAIDPIVTRVDQAHPLLADLVGPRADRIAPPPPVTLAPVVSRPPRGANGGGYGRPSAPSGGRGGFGGRPAGGSSGRGASAGRGGGGGQRGR